MVLIYGLLIVAMMFFFLLPITDARTARMKLVRGGQPRRPVGGMRRGAAPDTLTT